LTSADCIVFFARYGAEGDAMQAEVVQLLLHGFLLGQLLLL
jgi:hypothetical protein